MGISPDKVDINQILEYLKNLDARISRLEDYMNLEPVRQKSKVEKGGAFSSAESAESLEFHIGEYWFAKVGIAVLAIGIAFLLTLPYKNLPPILPSIIGYVLFGGILLLSRYWRESFDYVSRYLLGGALLLLYFTTLRLHFFSAQPAVSNRGLEVVLLLIVAAVNLVISARRKSVYLTGISLAMGYATAVVSDQTYLLFAIVSLMSALSIYFKIKYQWQSLLIIGILLAYFTHLIWFMNNPFMGNPLQPQTSPEANLFFILGYALLFAAGNLFRGENIPENSAVIVSTFLNCMGGLGLFLLISLVEFQAHIALNHTLASIIFLGLSIVFWIREKSRYSTFFYAMTGYAALSIAIIARFPEPESLVWLGWQSLLVISTAIWFRSKFIIVANFIIYICIFLAYLFLAETVSIISLSFGVVALLSARILNWKKDHLELKTELMRNAYLAATFFMFPYALYHIVPGSYVSLSWMMVAIFYYIMSRILNNIKYRWMAISTLLLTVLYVFLVDMTKLEPVFRVISFLLLAVVLIVISTLYSRMRAKNAPAKSDKETKG